MTKQEVIDILKTELNKSYTIRTTEYKNGKIVNTTDTTYPNSYLQFNREVIENVLVIMEGKNDI